MAYYVFDGQDCRFEGMTKEEILTAIEQGLEQGYVSDPDGAVISKIKEINASGTAQLWIGTEAEFNAITPVPAVGNSVVRIGADGIMYICTDDRTLANVQPHASRHAAGGEDEITPASIGAASLDGSGKVEAGQTSAAINARTASYTLSRSDSGKLVTINSADTTTVTIPAGVFSIGTEIEIAQLGAGEVAIAAASGVTVHSVDGMMALAGQYAIACLKKIAANEWLLGGGLA